MIRTIARHELRLLLRRGTLALVLAVWVATVGFALLAGSVQARAEAGERQALENWDEHERASLLASLPNATSKAGEDEAERDLRSAEHVANERGTFAVAPAAPLLALGQGHAVRYPGHVRVTARTQQRAMPVDQVAHPLWLLVGRFDLSFAVVYLLPLLVIVLAADLTANERRSGTLRMLLARPLPWQAVVAGKLLARGGVLAALGAASVVAVFGLVGIDGTATLRLVLWTAVAAAYLWFWLGLAVAVDARSASPAGSMTVLAGLWLLTVLLVPAALGLLVNAVEPPASGVAVATAVRNATHAASAAGSRLLGRFLEDHPSAGIGQAGMQQYAALQDAREREIAARLSPVLDALEEQTVARRGWLRLTGVISPAMLASAALNDAAGVGPERQRHVNGQIAAFHARWREHFAQRLLAAEPLSAEVLEDAPRFRFEEEAVSTVARRVWPAPVLLLIVGGGLLWWGARTWIPSVPPR